MIVLGFERKVRVSISTKNVTRERVPEETRSYDEERHTDCRMFWVQIPVIGGLCNLRVKMDTINHFILQYLYFLLFAYNLKVCTVFVKDVPYYVELRRNLIVRFVLSFIIYSLLSIGIYFERTLLVLNVRKCFIPSNPNETSILNWKVVRVFLIYSSII